MGHAFDPYQREPEAVRAPQSPSALFLPAGAFSQSSSRFCARRLLARFTHR